MQTPKKYKTWRILIMIKSIIKYAAVPVAAGLICANASAGAWKTERIGGLSTSLYTPDTTSPVGEGKSLLIVLHGCIQPTSNFKTANLDKAAEEYGMVIAVPDAADKAGMSCWGYWTDGWAGKTRSKTSGDYKRVQDMTKALISKSSLDIDPNQVYISGVSSGGAFAMTVGCMAPELYAGMGLTAAPSAGTDSGGALGPKYGTVASVARDCSSFGVGNKDYFTTQITSTAYGASDTTVNTGYGLQNAEAMASIYGVSKLSGTNRIEGKATETLWGGPDGKNRVSMVSIDGLAHAWPGGAGASGSYIGAGINYGMYLGEFFAQNNLRVRVCASCTEYDAKISGLAVDAPKGGSTAIVTASVEVPAVSTLRSIIVTVDGQTESVTGTSINEAFNVSQGDHTVAIVVTVDGDDGEEYVTEYSSTFNNVKEDPKSEVPSWCVYIPAAYWHYVPACAAGL